MFAAMAVAAVAGGLGGGHAAVMAAGGYQRLWGEGGALRPIPVALNCPNPPAPQVTVQLDIRPVRVSNRMASSRLGEQSINSSIIKTIREPHIGGLTVGQMNLQARSDFQILTDRTTGQACLWVTQVRATLSLQSDIYIAAEFPRGTCQYDATYLHELKHVEVDRRIARARVGLARQALAQTVARIGAIGPTQQVEQARDVFGQAIRQALDEVMRQIDRERQAAQDTVDTPTEYARVAAQCRGAAVPGYNPSSPGGGAARPQPSFGASPYRTR